MKIMFNEGLVMCHEHYHCPFESCNHYSWHEEKESCKTVGVRNSDRWFYIENEYQIELQNLD